MNTLRQDSLAGIVEAGGAEGGDDQAADDAGQQADEGR
jgi:hypothetical protein